MSCTAKTAIWPPSIASNRKKNKRGLNVTGQAAKQARLVMKLVSRMRGIDSPSAPTVQVRPISGSQLTRSKSCRPLRLGSYPVRYAATVIRKVIRVTIRAYQRICFPSPWSGMKGMSSAPPMGTKIDRLNHGTVACTGSLSPATANSITDYPALHWLDRRNHWACVITSIGDDTHADLDQLIGPPITPNKTTIAMTPPNTIKA